ncbi:MAG: chlorite dismutase family protein [Synechococcaceae cyanobacterium SM2_3_2]|nr:chlorite dismutase family protein [Synechococcaceae cyanobacterium SM2_3_2]
MNNHFFFMGGSAGGWRITDIRAIAGSSLEGAERLEVVDQHPTERSESSTWCLQGFASDLRYAKRDEVTMLRAIQPDLNRAEAITAVLIPIKKSAAWWELAQDERRAIFEEASHHTAVGMNYLPGVARRLLHCRDIGEPFDFLTWFEFAPEHTQSFATLLEQMRQSPEWDYVEREVEVWLDRRIPF